MIIKSKQLKSRIINLKKAILLMILLVFGIFYIIFIMRNQKSCGVSTKSSSNHLNSPLRESAKAKGFMLEEAKERQNNFLRQKNQQLRDLVLRMGDEIMRINKDKNELLALNSKYIDTLNKQFKQNHLLFDQIKTNQVLPKNGSPCKCKVLMEFESDYRDLVRHCMDLEQQIKSKNNDLSDFQNMKKQLMKSNHTSISELIEELINTTHQLVALKKAYNKQQFQLQKVNERHQKVQQTSKDTHKAASSLAYELQTYKSLINTITNESIDKENSYKSKIYSLELIIEKLQKDSRQSQKQFQLASAKNSILRAQKIEFLQLSNQQKGNLSNSRMVKSQSLQRSRKR